MKKFILFILSLILTSACITPEVEYYKVPYQYHCVPYYRPAPPPPHHHMPPRRLYRY